jgi:DeoR family transcriptional regulator of aga operon
VDGIDLDYGLTNYQCHGGASQQENDQCSPEKWSFWQILRSLASVDFGKICGLEDVDHIITDKGVSQQIVNHLEGLGVTVTIV